MTAVRRQGTASVVTLTALAFGLVAVNAIAPEWAASVGADVWNAPTARAEHRQAVAETQATNAHTEMWAERRARANQCAASLVAGTIDLGTAADQLRTLLSTDPGYTLGLQTAFGPQPSERHLFALHAIDRATRDEPEATRAALVERLEAEYQQLSCTP